MSHTPGSVWIRRCSRRIWSSSSTTSSVTASAPGAGSILDNPKSSPKSRTAPSRQPPNSAAFFPEKASCRARVPARKSIGSSTG